MADLSSQPQANEVLECEHLDPKGLGVTLKDTCTRNDRTCCTRGYNLDALSGIIRRFDSYFILLLSGPRHGTCVYSVMVENKRDTDV